LALQYLVLVKVTKFSAKSIRKHNNDIENLNLWSLRL